MCICKSPMLNPTCFFGVLLFLLRNMCIRFILIATHSFSLFTFSTIWIYCNLPTYPIVGLFGLFSVWEYHEQCSREYSCTCKTPLSPHIFIKGIFLGGELLGMECVSSYTTDNTKLFTEVFVPINNRTSDV